MSDVIDHELNGPIVRSTAFALLFATAAAGFAFGFIQQMRHVPEISPSAVAPAVAPAAPELQIVAPIALRQETRAERPAAEPDRPAPAEPSTAPTAAEAAQDAAAMIESGPQPTEQILVDGPAPMAVPSPVQGMPAAMPAHADEPASYEAVAVPPSAPEPAPAY